MDTQDRQQLLTRMEELQKKAQRTGVSTSKFLTPTQALEVERAFSSRKDMTLLLDGGFPDAERKLAVFLEPAWGNYIREDTLASLALRFREKDLIRHQDVMGAVLALGLSREVLGDIVIETGCAYLVCLKSMAEFISEGFSKVGRIGISLEHISLSSLPKQSLNLTEKVITAASLRLDGLIAAAFHLSRADAGGMILSGLVQLNHRECLNTSTLVSQDAVISVRGKGRIKLLSVLNETKKGRLRINLGFY